MPTVVAVFDPKTRVISEYTALDQKDYPDLSSFLAAVKAESQRLTAAYDIPASGLELFEGGASTLEGFFRWFHFKPPATGD